MINIAVIVKSESRTWTWAWCDLISGGQVCDLCWDPPIEESPVPRAATPWAPRRRLFPPTSPHPTLPRGSDWKPNMQILPVQTGWGTDDSNNDTLLLSSPLPSSFPLVSPRAVHVLLLLLKRCFNFWHNYPHTLLTPPPSLSLTPQFFPPSCQQANHRGMLKYHWLHPPPTHKPTLHLVIHLVPFTLCLIKLCWPFGFFSSLFLVKITLSSFVFVRGCQGVVWERRGGSRQNEPHRERCLRLKSRFYGFVTQD